MTCRIAALIALIPITASAVQTYDLLWYHHDDVGYLFDTSILTNALFDVEDALNTDSDGTTPIDTLDVACSVDITMSQSIECFWTYWGGDGTIDDPTEMRACFLALDRTGVVLYEHWNDALGSSSGSWAEGTARIAWFFRELPRSYTTIAHELGHVLGLEHDPGVDPKNIMSTVLVTEGVLLEDLDGRRHVNPAQQTVLDGGGLPGPGATPIKNDGAGVPFEG